MKKLLVALAATVLAVAMLGSGAVADTKQESEATRGQVDLTSQRSITDGVVDTPYERTLQQQSQLELAPNPPGLPPSKKNMTEVSKLQLTETDSVISDVTYHKGFAYLGEWIASCTEGEGGTYDSEIHVVNLKDRSNPREVATIPGNGNDWTGEGVHVIEHKNRDLLLLSSEPCDSNLDADVGGMTIVDVTNPRQPEKLVSNFGDWTTLDENGEPDDCRDDAEPCVTPHSVHSVMGWTDGNKAYAVHTDNVEAGVLDVDIFDITNPSNPVLIAETGLADWVDPLVISEQVMNGGNIFLHDFQVKKIDGQWRMMLSYWDVGWVLLDVDDPANPTFVDDYDYPDPDPLTGFSPAEGNAHQAWWSKDNRFVIGTDEDFGPFRIVAEVTSGDQAGSEFVALNGSATPQIDDTNSMEGTVRYEGLACDEIPPGTPGFPDGRPADPINGPESPDEIGLVQRGICSFTEKVQNLQEAGYTQAIIFNTQRPDGCGVPINALVEADIPTLAVGMDGGYALLDVAGYDEETCVSGGALPALPAPGSQGEEVSATGEFDGWGYVQLFNGTNLNHRDEYAVRESLDPRYAKDFGDLSVHEVKTDPRGNDLGYISYYHAGARVVKFGPEGIREVGHFISGRGNNFWGTFPIKRRTDRPIPLLMSDRDYGLYVLKYTGNQFTP